GAAGRGNIRRRNAGLSRLREAEGRTMPFRETSIVGSVAAAGLSPGNAIGSRAWTDAMRTLRPAVVSIQVCRAGRAGSPGAERRSKPGIEKLTVPSGWDEA